MKKHKIAYFLLNLLRLTNRSLPMNLFFSDNLRTIRKLKLDWTQQKTADEIGVKISTYQSWEEGRARPSYEILCRICVIFNVSIDNLLKRRASIGSVIQFDYLD